MQLLDENHNRLKSAHHNAANKLNSSLNFSNKKYGALGQSHQDFNRLLSATSQA
jgi:hypothetical protein